VLSRLWILCALLCDCVPSEEVAEGRCREVQAKMKTRPVRRVPVFVAYKEDPAGVSLADQQTSVRERVSVVRRRERVRENASVDFRENFGLFARFSRRLLSTFASLSSSSRS
jgi:hypothetical protein